MRLDLEWEYPDAEVSNEEVKNIGDRLGFYLPEDYIKCVSLYGGSNVYPDVFNLGETKKVFGNLFSFDKSSGENIEKMYDIYKLTLPKELFPIADDPSGNLICFDYKHDENNPIVVF